MYVGGCRYLPLLVLGTFHDFLHVLPLKNSSHRHHQQGLGIESTEEEGLIQGSAGGGADPPSPPLSFLNLSPCGRQPGLTTHNNSSTQVGTPLKSRVVAYQIYSETVSVHQKLCQTLSPCFVR